MPMNRHLYPKNWEDIALQIKEAANWTCQECGRECRKSGETLYEFCDRVLEGNFRDNCEFWSDVADHPQKWTLTVAHLNHEPGDCSPENLKALCAPCHCRYDLKAMAQKKRLKREREGQLTLEMLTAPEPAGQGKDPTRVQLPIRRLVE